MSNKNLTRFFALSVLLVFLSPVFADGNLTVASDSTSLLYVNTKQTYNIMNLTLNVTPAGIEHAVNVTKINFTIVGANHETVSAIVLKNSTFSIIGSSNVTSNQSLVTIINGLYVNTTTNSTILVFLTISENATRTSNIAINVTSANDIGTSPAESDDNITITNGSVQSISSTIQDLHATAALSPTYVDTNVFNQTFIYNITKTGTDNITEIIITVPDEYNITSIANITGNGADCITPGTCVVNTWLPINITIFGGYTNIKVNFTVNTSSSDVASMPFNSTISSSGNITGITTDTYNSSTNVETKQLISINSMSAVKNAAYINGTDYWEFNFTINVTANVSGLIHFKMEDWTDADGIKLNLTNDTEEFIHNKTQYYASLRGETNFGTTNKFNITNHYNASRGVSVSSSEHELNFVIMRMIIPKHTITSSTWYTTYKMLFRATP